MALKEKEHAKVHRIQRKHHHEMKINAYIRRLDKIYADLGKSPMLPRVVWKMRDQYGDDPHTFYKLVCQKYLIKPEAEIDAYSLVYGKTKFSDTEVKQDSEKVQLISSEQQDNIRDDWNRDVPTNEVKDDVPTDSLPFTVSSRKKQVPNQSAEQRAPHNSDFPRHTSEKGFSARPITRSNSSNIEYVRVQPGDLIETMVVTDADKEETGFWIPARILSIDMVNENMNIEVLHPLKYGLAKTAVNVPYRYVRSPSNSRVR